MKPLSVYDWMIRWEHRMNQLGYEKARIWLMPLAEGLSYGWTADLDASLIPETRSDEEVHEAWQAGMQAFVYIFHVMPDIIVRPPIMHDWGKVEE